MPDVIKRFQAEPAHQRGVAHNHRNLFTSAAHVTCQRKALPNRDARPRMATIKDVMRRFCSPWEATNSAELTQASESREATGEELMRIGLMSSVKDDAIHR